MMANLIFVKHASVKLENYYPGSILLIYRKLKYKENRMETVKIISTGNNSYKYGNCEICGKHACEIFHLFNYQLKPQKSKWGHMECLEKYAYQKNFKIRRIVSN